MIRQRFLTLVALLAVATSPLAARGANAQAGTIVDVASADPNFSTLVTAIKAAGLAETLAGPGPFTVFAPTNAAFAKLPAGTVDSLLEPKNKAKLKAILLYHVVAGTVMAADIKSGPVKTLDAKPVTLDKSDAGVKVNDATVVKADVAASNGVVHVIDTVLLPK